MSFLPNVHPVFVHFTIGMFLSGVILSVAAMLSNSSSLKHAANWNICGGAALTIVTAATGWLAAEGTAHGSGDVHTLMERHELLGLGSLGVLAVAAGLQLWSNKSDRSAWRRKLTLAVSVIGAAMLLVTGAAGGELVFVHGVGVAAVQITGSHEHSGDSHHEHAAEPESPQSEMNVRGATHDEDQVRGASGEAHLHTAHEESNGDESQANPKHNDHQHGEGEGQSHVH